MPDAYPPTQAAEPYMSEAVVMPIQPRNPEDSGRLDNLRRLAHSLHAGGRARDALLLLEHLDETHPGDADTLLQLVRLLGAEGQTLEAIEKLCAFKQATANTDVVLSEIREQLDPAIKRFNE